MAQQGAPAVVLTGPTGTGKTDWALRLAEELPVEIVSVDSAQVYRGLDIGTAKPSREIRARIPHHLIDIRDPAESYSAGQFVADATRLIDEISARGRLPLLVGGTMLYLRALSAGLSELPRASREVREEIDRRAEREGWAALHAELGRVDPEAAARIHPNDPQRIQRALEVYYTTGRPLTELQRERRATQPPPHLLRWALVPADRAALHRRLERRFLEMMERGFLDEVTNLHKRGDLTSRHPAIRAVGYRQLWGYLEGEYSLEEGVRRAIAATRQLAKRQLTWIRSEREIEWIDPAEPGAYENWSTKLRSRLGKLGR
ncbi:MAG: tRNA (adenosine(37)-N6)-dimethylallyltransferase MiaA [Pseudomonadota bacterium]|nr:MAG: tRNA (adenosine(37)-N6)-dimethylallyltransferase MiaA [Pseudomonadota bacterium]